MKLLKVNVDQTIFCTFNRCRKRAFSGEDARFCSYSWAGRSTCYRILIAAGGFSARHVRGNVHQVSLSFLRRWALYMVEPWRSRAFPIVKDLSADRIVQAGGCISVNGSAQLLSKVVSY